MIEHPPHSKEQDKGHEQEHCLSDFAVSLYLCAPENYPELEQHIHNCERCAAQVEERRQWEEAFLQQHPAEAFFEKLEQKQATSKKSRGSTRPTKTRWGWGQLQPARVLAAAAIVLVLVGVALLSRPAFLFGPKHQLVIRGPGSSRSVPRPWFRAYFRRGGTVHWATPADLFRGKDEFRFQYRLEEKGYLHLIIFDAQGRINQLYPAPNKPPLQLAPARRWRSLPGGARLDKSLHPERFWVCLSKRPLALSTIRTTLQKALSKTTIERLQSLALPCHRQTSLLLKKEKTP